jgi:hypothetical protein
MVLGDQDISELELAERARWLLPRARTFRAISRQLPHTSPGEQREGLVLNQQQLMIMHSPAHPSFIEARQKSW